MVMNFLPIKNDNYIIVIIGGIKLWYNFKKDFLAL